MDASAVSPEVTGSKVPSVIEKEHSSEQKRFLNIDRRIIAAATGALVGLAAMAIYVFANPFVVVNVPRVMAGYLIENSIFECKNFASILLAGGILGGVAGLVRSVVDKHWSYFADHPKIGDAVVGALTGGAVMLLKAALLPPYFRDLIRVPQSIFLHLGFSVALGGIATLFLAPVTILAATAARLAISKLVADKAPAEETAPKLSEAVPD